MASLPKSSPSKMERLPDMVVGVFSNEDNLQLEATTWIRKLLNIAKNRPIEEVIQSGVVPRFVEFLTRDDFPLLQFETAWALTLIASGTRKNTRVVINHGAVPILTKLLGSPNAYVRKQAAWALGNIAGHSAKNRDVVLFHGALNPLISLLNETTMLPILRIGTWTLSDLCRGDPEPVFEQIKPVVEALQRLVCLYDEEVLKDACCALSYLSDGTNDKTQAMIDAGVSKRLVELLNHPSPSVLIPTLHTVCNIAAGNDLQTQIIIHHGVLPCLLRLLTNRYKKSIKKDACWTIANITAGNTNQIQAVIDAGLIGPLVRLVETAEFSVKKKAAWAISNAAAGGTNEQIINLVKMNSIKPLCDLLVCPDARTVHGCLEGLENILRVGEVEKGNTGGFNYIAELIDEADGSDKIGDLLTHNNDEIYERALQIMETYWFEPIRRDQPTPRKVWAKLLKDRLEKIWAYLARVYGRFVGLSQVWVGSAGSTPTGSVGL